MNSTCESYKPNVRGSFWLKRNQSEGEGGLIERRITAVIELLCYYAVLLKYFTNELWLIMRKYYEVLTDCRKR